MARVLVVDDHAWKRRLVATVLRSSGHSIAEAADGREALEFLRADAADLVICDILMPTMNGDEFVRQLRQDEAIRRIAGRVLHRGLPRSRSPSRRSQATSSRFSRTFFDSVSTAAASRSTTSEPAIHRCSR